MALEIDCGISSHAEHDAKMVDSIPNLHCTVPLEWATAPLGVALSYVLCTE